MLFTNARASALFAGAIVLLATAFAGGQDANSLQRKDADRADQANLAGNAGDATETPGPAEDVDMAFMEDHELIQSSEGDDAGPDDFAWSEEISPQDSTSPDVTLDSDPASMGPQADMDSSPESP